MSADILIALVPALFWGILPVLVAWTGGRPIQQILGTTLGTLIAAVVVVLIVRPQIGPAALLFGALSGACWAFGQFNQYRAYGQIGVSQALPISTGLQLLGTSLVGVLLLGEWPTAGERLLGGLAIAIIIVGIFLTTRHEDATRGGDMKAGMTTLLISSLGYVGYSYFPRVRDLDGWSAFLPQAIGMFAMSVLLSLFARGDRPWSIKTVHNLGAGLVFAIAALAYLVSAQRNGVATGFALSQMNVVIATLGGIFIVGEKKTHREMVLILAGLALVVGGGILIGLNR
ncbi:glucose uptake protein [Sphingomonas sp. MM-1]|uniref:GRP family sugar transporter n=1 Tax=Sphingomonas sp. MM-1 TaxID=745310 RepID=UPI0002C0CFC7|nr:GRP family sugar transporter [Sphingomonas sp. MM-1]AGH50416.1 glucose uptake protein [Sphingomonas sp. MM-1]